MVERHDEPNRERQAPYHRRRGGRDPRGVPGAGCSNGTHWWRGRSRSTSLPGVPDELGALASYEADAQAITDWSVNLIPGLPQTYEYAKAYALDAGKSPEDVETIWTARLPRQQVLPKVDYTAYLGEAALLTPFGGPRSSTSSSTSSS